MAFSETRIGRDPYALLCINEWIWGDSAYYPVRPWIVPPFKKPVHGSITKEQAQFNRILSSIRVSAEHAFGLLKGRWQSLKEMRINIKGEKERIWMRNWIKACFILHNLIIEIEGETADEDERNDMIRQGHDEQQNFEGQGGEAGQVNPEDPRHRLMEALGLL